MLREDAEKEPVKMPGPVFVIFRHQQIFETGTVCIPVEAEKLIESIPDRFQRVTVKLFRGNGNRDKIVPLVTEGTLQHHPTRTRITLRETFQWGLH